MRGTPARPRAPPAGGGRGGGRGRGARLPAGASRRPTLSRSLANVLDVLVFFWHSNHGRMKCAACSRGRELRLRGVLRGGVRRQRQRSALRLLPSSFPFPMSEKNCIALGRFGGPRASIRPLTNRRRGGRRGARGQQSRARQRRRRASLRPCPTVQPYFSHSERQGSLG